jgi:phosphoribosylaminoimidazolecarboxamide formyltransferase / IMP cyclohydrolase
MAIPAIFLSPSKARELRYGENPHQNAWVYEDLMSPLATGLAQVIPSQGKPLSYNNILDADAAFRAASDILRFSLESSNNTNFKSGVVIIKHSNPCGAALSLNSLLALKLAWACDPVSSFGSIICFTDEVDESSANWLKDKFVEVILAPSFSIEAEKVLSEKKNLRVMAFPPNPNDYLGPMVRSVSGGYVVQSEDNGPDVEFKQMGKVEFPKEKYPLVKFGSVLVKHLKSNAIALVGENKEGFYLVGAGMGNPNRLVSIEQAVKKAQETGHHQLDNSVLVSDAFFPFRDNIDLAFDFGIKFIVEPGGSIKDKEVIQACDELGVAIGFTGRRHFRH